MSVFNNGGGDLKSANKPAALWEVVNLLKEQEQKVALALPQLATVVNRTTVTTDFTARTGTFTISVPLTEAISAAGAPTFTPFNYLSAASSVIANIGVFNPGAGGDLKSLDLPAAVLEMATIVKTSDLAIVPNVAVQQPNTVQVTYDTTTLIATVTGTSPITPTVDPVTGDVLIAAYDYLP